MTAIAAAMFPRPLSTGVLICFLAAPVSAQVAKPNFTGKWTLDVAKSDPQAPESISHEIDHKEPNITITTTSTWQGNEPAVQEQRFTTDGQQHTNKVPAMGAEREVNVTGKWHDEKLVTSLKFPAQDRTIEFSDSWSLSEGGNVLIFVRVAKTPQGDFPMKLVYNKQ